jgi:hypothetical protein
VSSSLAIAESSEVRHLRIELYRKDYRISNCDTADDSNCEIVNGVNVRASGINSLYAIRREVNCRVIHPTRENLVSELVYELEHASI